jgi:hypothetical protein
MGFCGVCFILRRTIRYRVCFAKLWRFSTAKDKLEEMKFNLAAKVVNTVEGGD